MPIYEYACGKCEHEFEAEQRITEDPIKTCPKCRSKRVKRLISRTSFVLKGGGWYADAYSSTDAKKSGKSDEGKSESTSSSKSDAKSDSKSGSKTGGGDGKKSGKKGSKAAA